MLGITEKTDWFKTQIQEKNPLVVTAAIGAILAIGIAIVALTRKGQSVSQVKVTTSTNIANPKTQVAMLKTAEVPSKIETLATHFSPKACHSPLPGDTFVVRPYHVFPVETPDGLGIMHTGPHMEILYMIDGPAAGRISVRFPDGSVCVMHGRFVRVIGKIDTWVYVGGLPHQPLAIEINRFTRTFRVTVL